VAGRVTSKSHLLELSPGSPPKEHLHHRASEFGSAEGTLTPCAPFDRFPKRVGAIERFLFDGISTNCVRRHCDGCDGPTCTVVDAYPDCWD
jgi:hypothetical protein